MNKDSHRQPDPSTQELARQVAGDAPEGFSNLYERVAPALHAWAALRIGSVLRRWLDPEDCVQEILLRAYKRFDSYDANKGSFRGWLFGIANNVMREVLARHSRVGTPRMSIAEAMAELPDDATSVSRKVARDEALGHFVASLHELTDEQRKLLVYRGLEGLPHQEVASLMGLSTSAVEKRWQRLLERLKPLGPPSELLAK